MLVGLRIQKKTESIMDCGSAARVIYVLKLHLFAVKYRTHVFKYFEIASSDSRDNNNARNESGVSCELTGNAEAVPGTPSEQENARTLGRREDQKLAILGLGCDSRRRMHLVT